MANSVTPIFVVYMGGTGGDMVSACIDSKDCLFNLEKSIMSLPKNRQALKKPHSFANDAERDRYVSDMSLIYQSLPSHDLSYHQRRNHSFLGITVSDYLLASWAADRFQQCHRPEVWQQIEKDMGISDVGQYAQLILDYSKKLAGITPTVICLEDILTGKLIDKLQTFVPELDLDIASLIYRQWLKNVQ